LSQQLVRLGQGGLLVGRGYRKCITKRYAVRGDLSAGKTCIHARFLEADFGTASQSTLHRKS
jgi:hypothetical protein